MNKWQYIFHKNTGLSPYIWVVFYILPFYFIARTASVDQLAVGVGMIALFFVCYVLSFISRGWLVYFWTSVQMAVSVVMTLLFGYMYFALFIAYFIGNIGKKVPFITFYVIQLVAVLATMNYELITKNPLFIDQLPFVLICTMAVILLPVTTYNRNKHDRLEGQLQDANKRIGELVKLEERQRISRDLHDTLGQKLSLIGLKSDLAGKLVTVDPQRALAEIDDVRKTARSALKEVREMVMDMRGTRLETELEAGRQLLEAAQIRFELEGDPRPAGISLMTENVLGMCVKEAITNIVKHSEATECRIAIQLSRSDVTVKVEDNGRGIQHSAGREGHGLRGMRERLEFVNGSLGIFRTGGTALLIKAPIAAARPKEELVL